LQLDRRKESRLATQRVGYVRSSIADSGAATAQLQGIHTDRTFTDEGSSAERPQLQEALRYVRDGDTLVVHSMDRVARNLADLLRLVETLVERGVRLEIVQDALTFSPPDVDNTDMAPLLTLRALAAFDRAVVRERQREGIALAKQMPGKYKGRAPALNPEQIQELQCRDSARGGRGRAALAREFGISRQTLYSYLAMKSTV
jgi:DNA invertase Pin-like site-specific DNA recombinase